MKVMYLLLLSILTVACVSQSSVSQVVLSSAQGQKIVDVEIADNQREWTIGLMNRDSLEEDAGMLFIFPDSKIRSFWMKNTLIPLDIIFISDDFRIIDIATLQPCKADPCPSYISKQPARYVLEVNANYVQENNITLGGAVAIQSLS